MNSIILPLWIFPGAGNHLLKDLFIFWLWWVFATAHGLSLTVARGSYSLPCADFSLQWVLLLWSTGSRLMGFCCCSAGSVVVACWLSCSVACGIVLDEGSNRCPLHCKADSWPLNRREARVPFLKMEPFFSSLLDLPDYHPFSVLCQLNFAYLPDWKSREIEDRKTKEALKCVSEQSLQPKLSTKHSRMLNGSLKLTQAVTCSLCKGFLKRNAIVLPDSKLSVVYRKQACLLSAI